jgi:hypothetical protein
VNKKSHIGVEILVVFAMGYFAPLAFGDLKDADKAEELARKTFAEKYLEFTGDKNVMGKAMSVDGKVQLTGNKTRFDQDDGVSYKSDLTYHDLAYTSEDENNNQKNKNNPDPNAKNKFRRLQPFVSPHGGLSESGGSSALEREMYQQFDKLSQQDEKKDPNNPRQQDKGIENKGVFKITTKEIFEDPKTQQANANQNSAQNKPDTNSTQDPRAKDKEKDKVERLELRDEVKQGVEKIGSDSAQTVIQAAKDKESKEDPNALPNELLMYDAASRATNAMWNAGMANLYQRRIFKGLNDSTFFDPPKLSEDNPDCSSWEKQAQEKMAKLNPQERQDRQKEFELMKKGCDQMSKMPFNSVDPRYEADPNNPKVEILKERGPKKEDAFARDMRIQLDLMSSAGKSINDVQTNWKYDPEDEKVELKNGDEIVKQTMAEQLDAYNQQLEAAKAAYDKVKSEDPNSFRGTNDPTQYRIEPGTQSVMEINQRPAQGFDSFGVDANKLAEPNAAQNYEELNKNMK